MQTINTETHQNLILVVDDVSENIKILGSILSSKGYRVSAAINGEQALKAATNVQPDLILLDIQMPGMDGYEVCKKLKENEYTRNIPVFFLTARNETEDIIHGFEIGAVDYITKPFKSAELIMRISNHIQLKKAKEEIDLKNKELQKLNVSKDRFFSIIAHDLKNPLSAIMGFSEIIKRDVELGDWDNIKSHVEYLTEAINIEYSLLENLLEWSRAQLGHLVINKKLLNLKQIAANVAQIFATSAQQKNIILHNNVFKEVTVFADENTINTVIRNLVSNAIKFTPTGGQVIISAAVDNDNTTLISITDTGVGIDPATISLLFKIEEHFTTCGTSEEKGTGLGLILCKEFVELNGGRIWVESEIGHGSMFTFTLANSF